MSKQPITIEETPNIFDDNLLDIFGNAFKFDHVKGMAELLKNSVDAYGRKGVKQEDQNIVFRFTDQGVTRPIIECIDFVGMTAVDIDKALKRWGDPTAAKRGKSIKTFGGHGNGGKFYMRQMFEESRFVTYKDGFLNVFGFNENKKYGYATGFKDKKMKPKDALEFAEVSSLPMSDGFKKRFLQGEFGFTVVQGIGPDGIKTKIRVAKEMERFKNHPQSRRILLRTNVSVIYNNHSWNALLRPDELESLENFEEPRVITVPEELILVTASEKIRVKMATEKYPAGRLILKTSAEALARGSKLGELNRIDIIGDIGTIGSYQLSELRVTGFPHAAFIYGEFGPASENDLSILEDPNNACVSNDRAKLEENDITKALLEWIASEVDKLAAEIAAVEREKQKVSQKEITSKFNDVLNEWKNKHMRQIISELFGASGGEGGKEGEAGNRGSEVTAPPNGFDFKYPKADVQLDSLEKVTLKVSVPQCLPIGATILFETTDERISLSDSTIIVKSDFLKATPDGQDVAFVEVEVVGTEMDAEATLIAKAGKLTASMRLKVVAKKESDSGKSFPRVLLSGQADPLGLAPGGILVLGERDPIVYQRLQDVAANIYWINTESPMASKIYDKFSFDSIQWRNFLFERYIDIFVKEAVHELERKDYENFNADAVDFKISEVVRRIHQSAKDDLEQFLFEENYSSK